MKKIFHMTANFCIMFMVEDFYHRIAFSCIVSLMLPYLFNRYLLCIDSKIIVA